jgi:hypothetical protein
MCAKLKKQEVSIMFGREDIKILDEALLTNLVILSGG